jgi:hypothetical protein
MLKRLLARTASVAVVVIITDFFAGWILLPRVETDIRTYHPYYHHGLLPNRSALTNWTRTNSYVLTTNSLGLRDSSTREVPLTSPRRRIVFVGDSFTEGVGVTFDKTFVGVLQRSPEGHDLDMFNAGVVSYSGMTDYLKIKYLTDVVGFRFDELVVFYDLSDPYNDYLLEYYEQFRPRQQDPALAAARRVALSFMARHSTLFYNFALIYNYERFGAFDREFTQWTLDRGVFDRWAGKGLHVSMKYIQELVDLCRNRQIRMAIAVYPWANLVEKRDLHSLMVSVWSDFASRNGIALINYFPDFINDTPSAEVIEENFRPVDQHWTERGHAMIARRLSRYIQHAPAMVAP